MSLMSSRALYIACSRGEMSRDSALVMFFYMRLEKHVCNAMSMDLLFALAVVSFDHLITSTHSPDICCYSWSASDSCPTSFAGDSSPIPDDIVYFVILPESKDSRTSRAGSFYPIPDEMRVCFDSLCICLSLSLSLFLSLSLSLSLSIFFFYIYIYIYTYLCIYNNVNIQVYIHIYN